MKVASIRAFLCVLGVVITAVPRVVRAQTTIIKPEFLLLVDTSDSMNTTTGTGNNSCGYRSRRINDAACVIRNLADGAGDAIFGMGTFSMTCNGAVALGDHYSQGAQGSCGSTTCNAPPGADPVTTTNRAGPAYPLYGCGGAGTMQVGIGEPNMWQLRSWGDGSFTSCTAYPASPMLGGPELSTGVGDVLGSGATRNGTPLSGLLREAYSYLSNQLAPTFVSPYVNFNGTGQPDPYASCRPLNVVLLTDGNETCQSNAPRGSRLNARNISCLQVDVNGRNGIENPIPMSDPNPALRGKFESNIDINGDGDCLDVVAGVSEQRAFKTRTYAIGFGVACNDGDIEAMALAGGVPSHVIPGCNGGNPVYGYYGNDEREIAQAINDIIASSALVEQCNGLDDDCDGLTDEDWPLKNTACGVGRGQCRNAGTYRCNALQDDVVCANGAGVPLTPLPAVVETTVAACANVVDDDCDGFTDCQDPDCATIGSCRPGCNQPEVCDGLDNNCNGTTDEGSPGAGQPCGSTLGICTAGTTACTAGRITCAGGVQATTEVCNGRDDNCNGATDEGLTQACGSSVGTCQPGVQLCTAGAFSGSCIGSIAATTEVCNGRDDNCNGTTDEGIAAGGACGASMVGICRPGTVQCSNGSLQCIGGQQPAMETCNSLDDDCNGATDDNVVGQGTACTAPGVVFPLGMPTGECRQGMTLCRNGATVCDGTIGPSTEVCDSLDNDCDGMTDEMLGGMACGSSGCAQGVTRCVAGRIDCMGGQTSMPEICNGMDDNCNGMTDEGNPGGGVNCGMDIGRCNQGVTACRGGMIACDGGVLPTTEICNGQDDDCNGMTDDGLTNVGMPCGRVVGECLAGTTRCLGGSEVCEGERGPRPEECDCKDNDCDGMTDNQATGGSPLCGDNSVCVGAPSCGCLRPCSNASEFRCPIGRRCETVNGQELCVGDLCANVRCNTASETCIGGTCVPRCQGVACGQPLVCNPATGMCVTNDCNLLNNCATGQICRNQTCQVDPCAAVMCATGQACFNGTCRATCDTLTCSTGQTCVQGQCVATSMCTNVTCSAGQVCNAATGMCQPNRCTGGRVCSRDQVCDAVSGQCIDDPCRIVRCPTGQSCSMGECVRPAPPPIVPADRVVGTGGGGVTCSVSTPGSSSRNTRGAVLLGVLALGMLARRSRKRS